MNEKSKSKLRAMGAKISIWKRQLNSCAAAQCWKCGCRIRLGKMVYERREEVSDFRGDDKVSWACVPCMTKQKSDTAKREIIAKVCAADAARAAAGEGTT